MPIALLKRAMACLEKKPLIQSSQFRSPYIHHLTYERVYRAARKGPLRLSLVGSQRFWFAINAGVGCCYTPRLSIKDRLERSFAHEASEMCCRSAVTFQR